MVGMTSSKSASRSTAGRSRTRGIVPIVVLLAVVAAAVVVPLSRMSTDRALELIGVPDPGLLPTAGLRPRPAIGALTAGVAADTAPTAAVRTPAACAR